MKFIAEIDVMPHKELLDPQGKAVESGLKNLQLDSLSNVRIGKHISLAVDAANKEDAEAIVTTACKQLLVNQIMESFHFELKAID